MSIVKFPCPRCGQPMGVRPEHLGQTVRCPHCRQTVEAREDGPPPPEPPEAAPGANAEPVIVAAPPGPPEGIFDAAEEVPSDALFGPSPPLVELPPNPPVPNLQVEAAPPPDPVVPPIQLETLPPSGFPPAGPEPTAAPQTPAPEEFTYTAPEPTPPSEPVLNFMAPPARAPESPSGSGLFPDAPASARPGAAAPTPPGPSASGVHRPASRAGMFIPTLLIFLIPYSIVATVAVVMLYLKKQQPSLELLPDPYPDPKAGGPAHPARRTERVRPDLDLPARLVAPLDKHPAVRVGDLEVVPEGVEWAGAGQLRLVLRLRNVSRDVDFNPVSNRFLEHERNVPAAPKPYTFLEADGRERVYGGEWETLREDQPFDGRLGPGEALTAQLITDPRDARKVRALKDFRGLLLWRLQLRRGFVEHRGKEVSATAVVGVRFGVNDVRTR